MNPQTLYPAKDPAKVIIDTDPGVDDAIAILMALAAPSLDVIGLTTVGGNVPLARTTRNALALLEYAGRSGVPVARGSPSPIRGRYQYASVVHGKSGLSRKLPNPKTEPIKAAAVDFLATRLRDSPGQITLIALGPLTNLARLLTRHPDALRLAAALVVMGGAVDVPGNVTSDAEFNFYSDPEAASLILSSAIPLTLVDLAVCHQVAINREEAGRLKARNRLGALAVQLMANWFRRDASRKRFEFYDPLAMAVALDPEIITTRSVTLTVETADPARLGATRVTAEGGPIALAQRVDRRGFFDLLEALLGLEVGPAS